MLSCVERSIQISKIEFSTVLYRIFRKNFTIYVLSKKFIIDELTYGMRLKEQLCMLQKNCNQYFQLANLKANKLEVVGSHEEVKIVKYFISFVSDVPPNAIYCNITIIK